MAFCTNCGQQIADNSNFCANCGTPVAHPTSKTERKTVYDGEIHKCPHCGEVLKAFETVCPACNLELRGSKSSSAVRDLAEKLERATSEEQRIIIIKNFPIPNTKEDIFEFMLLASSNFDVSYYTTHIHEEDISDAWLTKIEQCYQKAKLSFSDYDAKKIEAIYFSIKEKTDKHILVKKKKIIFYSLLIAIGALIFFISANTIPEDSPLYALPWLGIVLALGGAFPLMALIEQKEESRIKKTTPKETKNFSLFSTPKKK